MEHNWVLLPQPRQMALSDKRVSLPSDGLICIEAEQIQPLLLAARQLQECANALPGTRWSIVGGTAVPADRICAVLSLVPGGVAHSQGYVLTVAEGRVQVVASTPAGLFYGVQTVRQLLGQHGRHMPELHCVDWPDFPNRGVMLDVSRNRVPTMATLRDLIDLLASWKINQIQLYFENAFAYQQHDRVWQDVSPFTAAEIAEIDRFCQDRHIELVPNQNSFGHLTNWLVHPKYSPLAEAPDGCETEWGPRSTPFGLQPTEESLNFLRTLYDELLPNFSSRQFNVGLDETIDLGKVRSKELADQVGVGRLYLDFLLKIHREVRARGRTMQFWGDIITHYPALVREVPRDAVALEWGYEADHPFEEHGALFAASGVPFYVCPGTSTWNSLVGRTTNAVENLRNAARSGLKHGAVGYLITDWGDNGHWQPLPVSYVGLAAGAGYAWAFDANRDLNLADVVGQHAFKDTTGIMGRVAVDLGDIYRLTGFHLHNASLLFRVLQATPDEIIEWMQNNEVPDPAPRLRAVLDAVDGIMGNLVNVEMRRSDAELIQREFIWGANMVRHACWRALWVMGKERGTENDTLRQWLQKDADKLLPEYEALWHARSRAGGFHLSRERLTRMCQPSRNSDNGACQE